MKRTKTRYYNQNPETQKLHATLKLHKNPVGIQPTVNWKSSPAYPLAIQMSRLKEKQYTECHKKMYTHFIPPFCFMLDSAI
jgi:hypothetical protein